MTKNGKSHSVGNGKGKEDARQNLIDEICKLRSKSVKSGLTHAKVDAALAAHHNGVSAASGCCNGKIRANFRWFFLTCIPIALGLVVFACREEIFMWFDDPCIIGSNFIFAEIGRPNAPCDLCRNLTEVPTYETITPAEFVAKHAYNIRPALVTGATANWTAMGTFNYDFFKELYGSHPEALDAVEKECQFFPYNTEFGSLKDAFEMPADRAALKDGEKHWYFGWSNCDPVVAVKLRKHYQRPYFLPESSESSALDWIFMGGPGVGAGIHLDNVEKPSWQAQLSGKKTWTLLPLPECENICHELQVTVNTGDIIVLDTNQWYHTTRIHPGKISITIGSEFD
ncbi:uncharacterized protein LOC117292562 [Asterias rubens]|uniref:uncharacterized protein LOC117292562 n=1 Tax=Asterias rubens TaxID=7604 RepID=UPI001454F6A0|nr:uncharacterized protein LOC117292562 [Asterias rubens]